MTRSTYLVAILVFLNPSSSGSKVESTSASLGARSYENGPKLGDLGETEKDSLDGTEVDYLPINPDERSMLGARSALLLASARVPLDKISGSVAMRELDDTYPEALPSQKADAETEKYAKKRNFDEIDRAGFQGLGKRNFDEIDRAGFGRLGKRYFDEIDRAGFHNFGKRNFDEIDSTGFRVFGKRNFDEIDRAGFRNFGKRNFDEIDRAGFRALDKKNFDEIDRAGFRGIGKRNFDEIDRAGFRALDKKNFDEIDRAGFRGLGKRNFDEIDRAGFRVFGKRNFDEIDRAGFRGLGKRNFDEIDRAGFRGLGKRSSEGAGNNFSLLSKFLGGTSSGKIPNVQPHLENDTSGCRYLKKTTFKEAAEPIYPASEKQSFDETYNSGFTELKKLNVKDQGTDVAA